MQKKTTVGTVAGNQKLDPNLFVPEAIRFLQLLGKDPARTWLRTITPGKGANRGRNGRDLQGFDAAALEADSTAGAAVYFITGDADQATGKKKDGKHSGCVVDADVHTCRAVYVEWDDRPIDWQVQAWRELGLPEPTALVQTGGKSVHCYWRLVEPMAPAEWRVLQARLIDYSGGDSQCKNPSRLMRLPGFRYIDKSTGKLTDRCAELIHEADVSYSAVDIAACIPAPVPQLPPRLAAPAQQLAVDLPLREMQAIRDAVAVLPPRSPQTYEQFRNALCGCSAALSEINHPNPDGEAISLMGHLWEHGERQAAQVLESTTTRNPASFWAIAREHGYDLKRSATAASSNAQRRDPTRAEVQQRTYSELLNEMLKATMDGDDDELMELRAEAIGRFRRTDAQIEAALFKLHTQQEIGGKATQQPESLDLSRISGMDWLVEGFIPDNDQTLIWGNAGGGKTTAALSAGYSVLRGTGLLDHNQPAPTGSVLFIASDSGAPPLYAAMQDMGMADMPEVQDGPEKRFHVWASDPDQGMTAWAADLRGCIRLLQFIKQHGIRLVLIDSCKAVCSGAGLDYTNNQLVTALLTYFKEVICPHTAVVWLNHDGVAKGAHAGAKAWKEIPSMVHSIIREENKDGSPVNNRRLWRVGKSRMGATREFYYELNQGELRLCPNQEKVGNCLARVVDVLWGALQCEGQDSLAKTDLVERICMAGGPSRKTLENTLSTATRGKHPEVCRAGRGRYKLAPRIVDSLKGCILNGKEQGQNVVRDSDLSSSRQVPGGKFWEDEKFPVGINGKSPERSAGLRSGQVPSQRACTPFKEVAFSGLELVELKREPVTAGSGADAFADGDDPAWPKRQEVA
jgi:hypothetical protein